MPEDIYEGNDNYRYAIGIKGKDPLIFIGINPSTGTPENYDQTMKRARYFALKFKFASWIMFNIYPKRITNPECLDQECKKKNHEKNMKTMENLIPRESIVVAAWGNINVRRENISIYLKDIVKILNNKDVKWKHISSLTVKGHPKQITCLSNDEKLFDFDINNYLKRFM